ncbi:LacI family DNA-binding transcriptional regulator [Qiania dongpingensis]|uniref:LacI family DNA-binding transcriptional regulator n=1 Tax=Qiania dongpingensis TaxID=2763669 RepID=A0A7G9G0P2_9FIRM|nr:LacI family DNA-binding transcriptional regulator [Qiania dongpingensis]QNM04374.1 LacI family DNA-binding transcriptional regulator [Qiania dongpingensis]
MDRDRGSKDVTIKDVAKRAGVAISTVSRVLNGLDKVSPKTEKKVKEAVEELGYVQNGLAVSMVTGQTRTIMMVVPDFTNDFNGAVIQGAEEYLKEQGYTMLIFSTKDFKEEDFENLYRRFSKLVDGVLVVPANPDDMDYGRWEKPLVLIDCYRPGQDYYTVEIDNAKGGYLLARELLLNGHTRIGLVGGIPGASLGGQRIAGFERAMKEYGVPVDKRLMMRGQHFEDTGYRGMKKLWDLPDRLRPTGVVAVNNLTCIGCMEALSEQGAVIGEDISLVGFDDHLLARYSVPGITVIVRPTIEMGREGAKLLVRQLRKEEIGQKRVVMEIKLKRRNSVKRLLV